MFIFHSFEYQVILTAVVIALVFKSDDGKTVNYEVTGEEVNVDSRLLYVSLRGKIKALGDIISWNNLKTSKAK